MMLSLGGPFEFVGWALLPDLRWTGKSAHPTYNSKVMDWRSFEDPNGEDQFEIFNFTVKSCPLADSRRTAAFFPPGTDAETL